MQGASRGSLASARERLRALLAGTGSDHAAVADGLFAVADLLDANVSLRRALTDPSSEGEQKASIVQRLLSGKVPSEVVDLVAGLVRDRWARTRDLPDAIDTLGADTVLSDAEATGRLDAVEDEPVPLPPHGDR
ncbi:hypothetical protein GCM10025868_38700 [Angustibacter aerolatus]|uniref:F0F1 ATP synthase subunit delta n=1 Tax=Angustibacter aerolatus TaxID=1162965 RepID=A0ABQ6JK29_9ACTN|nr:hypothetical protein [Angustibacter aerolatus]GMA88620.1 hypothetical protein GCM10025868_38700 [Angustibacter aerolatus]